jgi:hypothetical protein
MDKIQMVAFYHPAMTPVYEKYTTNRTLSTSSVPPESTADYLARTAAADD